MSLRFREAREADIPVILALMADDVLGQAREKAPSETYIRAFREIEAEPGNSIIVGERDGSVIATYQLTIISGLSLSAARRGQIESVRVASSWRGQGIGAALLRDAEDRARRAGAVLLQLTTNKSRNRTHAFYRAHGFQDTHLGFKKSL